MTDTQQVGTEWVPPLGMLEELPSEHAAVIRGLFELAAFVAVHPEFRAPVVQARFYLPWDTRPSDAQAEYAAERELVDGLAVALGVGPIDDEASGHYTVRRALGGVEACSVAITPARMARYDAERSYTGSVQPDEPERAKVFTDDAATVGGMR
ncbi:hypothetical protein ACFTSF_04495 [Kribbella sp. NPDC056951]|uniref:hypothetical protein n=1 Tax=Kribbella sp. NPDC056951 TaxID=3345978 RepID=UPI0036436DA3